MNFNQKAVIHNRFDVEVWITLLDTATVMEHGKIVFRFKNGDEKTA